MSKRLPAFSCRARPGVNLSAEVKRAALLALGRPHPAAVRAAKRAKHNALLLRKQSRRLALGWRLADPQPHKFLRRFIAKHGRPRPAYCPIVKVEFLTA